MQEVVLLHHPCDTDNDRNLTANFNKGSGYYTKLPSSNCLGDDFNLDTSTKELNSFIGGEPKSPKRKAPSTRSPCITALFSFLYRFLVAFLRALCFRLPRNSVDNESLLTVGYNVSKNKAQCVGGDDEEEGHECHVMLLHEKLNPRRASLKKNHSYIEISSSQKSASRCKVIKPNNASVAIRASQVKGKVIASKGKDQLTATKAVVDKSKQQLREVCDDVTNIRSDIKAAKRLFSEVEKGIKEYKWDTFARDTWATVEHNGQITYFPVLSAPLYASPYQKMYSEHRIFIEEMKFHFKWNHGILL